MQRLLGDDTVSRVDVLVGEGATTAETIDAIDVALTGQPYVLSSPADIAASLRSSTADFRSTTALIAAVALFVGAFLIFNTLSMTVTERVRELGLLRAAGATRRQLTGFVLAQAATLGVAGAASGARRRPRPRRADGAPAPDDRRGPLRAGRSPAGVGRRGRADRSRRDARGGPRAGASCRLDPAGRGAARAGRALVLAAGPAALARRRVRGRRRRGIARLATRPRLGRAPPLDRRLRAAVRGRPPRAGRPRRPRAGGRTAVPARCSVRRSGSPARRSPGTAAGRR